MAIAKWNEVDLSPIPGSQWDRIWRITIESGLDQPVTLHAHIERVKSIEGIGVIKEPLTDIVISMMDLTDETEISEALTSEAYLASLIKTRLDAYLASLNPEV